MKTCPVCGCEYDETLGPCPQCDKPKKDAEAEEAVEESRENRQQAKAPEGEDKLKVLSDRIHTESVIWLIIGICQILFLGWGITTLAIGAWNIYNSIKGLKYSKDLLVARPSGLVAAYEPIAMPIVNLVLNLIFGGVIGVVGALYNILAVRGYVMENRDYFDSL